MSSWRSDMQKSSAVLHEVVWPRVQHIFGGGRLLSTEGNPDEALRILDVQSGVDAIHILKNNEGTRLVASRVQYLTDDGPIRSALERVGYTFTIRLRRLEANSRAENDIEYAKRLAALSSKRGLTLPYLWMHSYVTARCTACGLSIPRDRWNPQCKCEKPKPEFMGSGVIRTEDLFAHTEQCKVAHVGWAPNRTRHNESRCYRLTTYDNGASEFLVVTWRHLELSGVDIKTVIAAQMGMSPETTGIKRVLEKHAPSPQLSLLDTAIARTPYRGGHD